MQQVGRHSVALEEYHAKALLDEEYYIALGTVDSQAPPSKISIGSFFSS